MAKVMTFAKLMTYPPEFIGLLKTLHRCPSADATAEALGCTGRRAIRICRSFRLREECPSEMRGRPFQIPQAKAWPANFTEMCDREIDECGIAEWLAYRGAAVTPQNAMNTRSYGQAWSISAELAKIAHKQMRRQFIFDLAYGFLRDLVGLLPHLSIDQLRLCKTKGGIWQQIGQPLCKYDTEDEQNDFTAVAAVLEHKLVFLEYCDRPLTSAVLVKFLEESEFKQTIGKKHVLTFCDNATYQDTPEVRDYFDECGWPMVPQWPSHTPKWLPVQTYFADVLRRLKDKQGCSRLEVERVFRLSRNTIRTQWTRDTEIRSLIRKKTVKYWGDQIPTPLFNREMDDIIASRRFASEPECWRDLACEFKIHWTLIRQRHQMLCKREYFRKLWERLHVSK
jgi:hypothetical protein